MALAVVPLRRRPLPSLASSCRFIVPAKQKTKNFLSIVRPCLCYTNTSVVVVMTTRTTTTTKKAPQYHKSAAAAQ
jgi:hypothetical protein